MSFRYGFAYSLNILGEITLQLADGSPMTT